MNKNFSKNKTLSVSQSVCLAMRLSASTHRAETWSDGIQIWTAHERNGGKLAKIIIVPEVKFNLGLGAYYSPRPVRGE